MALQDKNQLLKGSKRITKFLINYSNSIENQNGNLQENMNKSNQLNNSIFYKNQSFILEVNTQKYSQKKLATFTYNDSENNPLVFIVFWVILVQISGSESEKIERQNQLVEQKLKIIMQESLDFVENQIKNNQIYDIIQNSMTEEFDSQDQDLNDTELLFSLIYYCLYNQTNFESAILIALNEGRNFSLNCAIFSSLLGGLYGPLSIPDHLMEIINKAQYQQNKVIVKSIKFRQRVINQIKQIILEQNMEKVIFSDTFF
ncbi:ADP-ribosylation/Crystallin J1 [Pseudocohnilembus persalinus]|uniref:ADP-ribosylation/Crystallin J1 n=1 Tax=Pseudocohnilembus persalinus TaxID=266149 RepID=A0A0V0QG27_PSEPJ|nr:ADP-ribosylation/Crystallin J1 [Pseudocohnilembus persalinus]|eukprot:KRX01132.1 ADP-ribosylation/Crystallin J1 [Pseudocohnilembus persalinus]